jgi:hypothetical protein
MNDCPLKLDDMFGDTLVNSISKKNPKMQLENWTVSESNSSICMFLVCVCTFVNLLLVQVYVCLFLHLFVSLCVCSFVLSFICLFVCLFFRLMHRQVSLYINRGLGFHTNAVNGIKRTTETSDQKSNQIKSNHIFGKKNCSLINLWHIKS